MAPKISEEVELCELLNTRPTESVGTIVKWSDQADYLVAIAGFFAILVGFLAISDVIATSHNTALKSSPVSDNIPEEGRRYAIFHGNPDIVALILFGAVTAAAWTTNGRAIFRATSLDSIAVLSKGVRQSDLSNIFELKLPSTAWLSWRLSLWRSSAFSVLTIILYAGSALNYRLAFSTRTQFINLPVLTGHNSTPFLGCEGATHSVNSKDGLMEKYTHLMGRNGDAAHRWVYAHWNATPSRQESDWQVIGGWHNYKLWEFEMRAALFGNLTGPMITIVSQWAGNETSRSSYSATLEVVAHPSCGNLTKICQGIECSWIGLWLGNYAISYEGRGDDGESWFNRNQPRTIGRSCPLQLNSTVYEQVTEIMELDIIKWRQSLTNVVQVGTLILSYISVAVWDILEEKPLQDLGLLRLNTSTDYCPRLPAGYSGAIMFETKNNFWPTYQYFASFFIIIWGILLLIAAYPYKSILIRGKLDQYMSFGADLQKENMVGASSGLRSSGSRKIWRLKARSDNGVGRVFLEEYEGELGEVLSWAEKPRLIFKTWYT